MQPVRIMLDPGHGGKDIGAASLCPGIWEKEITLIFARLVALRLRHQGIESQLTRWGDQHRSGWRRLLDAKIWGADVLVSIHTRTSFLSSERGFEVHYNPKSLEGRLVARGIIGKYLKLVQKERPFVLHGTGFYGSDLPLLQKSKMPSVLVNLGFLSNDADMDLLTSPLSFGKMAAAVADHLCSDQLHGMIS